MYKGPTFVADTREEADRLAEEHMKKIDPYRQPHIGYYWKDDEGKYHATVCYYGLD